MTSRPKHGADDLVAALALERRQQGAERTFLEIVSRRPELSRGHRALIALQVWHTARLAPPEWAVTEVVSCFRDFEEGARPGGFIHSEFVARPKKPPTGPETPTETPKAPRTLGEAFGVNNHSAKQMEKRRQLVLVRPHIVELLTRETGSFDLKHHDGDPVLDDTGAPIVVTFPISTGKGGESKSGPPRGLDLVKRILKARFPNLVVSIRTIEASMKQLPTEALGIEKARRAGESAGIKDAKV